MPRYDYPFNERIRTLLRIEDLFTKVNDQNYTIAINSGTIEMKDNKVIVLAD